MAIYHITFKTEDCQTYIFDHYANYPEDHLIENDDVNSYLSKETACMLVENWADAKRIESEVKYDTVVYSYEPSYGKESHTEDEEYWV